MDFQTIKEYENQYYLKTFSRYDVCFTHGKGCKLYDTEGREYVDFLGGIAVNALGYGDPELVKAICEQAGRLIHVSNLFYSEPQSLLVKNLLEGTDFARAFLCNSGAEANEGAIKLARKYYFDRGGKKYKFVTALNSFHGRTLATATATGQTKYSKAYTPLPDGFEYVPYNDIAALEQAVDEETCAVILETIQGEGGVIEATSEYLKAAERLCRERDALLIIDEVQTGMGRCGELFSYQAHGIRPDIVTLAKALGGGVPIGALLASEKLSETFSPGDHGSTFGGNPLACAAANVVVGRLRNTDLLAQIREKGDYFKRTLSSLKKHSSVLDIRGKGLLIGLELEESVSGKALVKAMLGRGYILNCAGHNTLRFAPPFPISGEEIDGMVKALDECLANM